MGYSAMLLGFTWLVMINSIGFAAVLPMNHIIEVNNVLIDSLKMHVCQYILQFYIYI